MLWPPIDDADPRRLEFLTRRPFAHRGLHGPGAPENGWTAFDRAVDAGVGIELDVRLTRDGDAVVFHDETLDRMTGATGLVAERSRADLEKLALAGSSDTVRSLHDTLRRIAGRAPVLIEAKTSKGANFQPICFAVRRALEGYRGEAAVMSFNPLVVGWFARHHPKVVRGLVMTEAARGHPLSSFDLRRRLSRQAALWRARPHFIAYDVRHLPAKLTDGARRRGRPVLTWTVRTPEDRARGRTHADQLIFEGDIPDSAS